MWKTMFVILIISICIAPIMGVNHLDEMFMIQGTQRYGDFGAAMTALDFNGDGFDDLAVLQLGWVPDSLINNVPNARYGKILIYYGGTGFDSVADFTIEGTYQWHLVTSAYAPSLVSVGDVNGDGCDDLGVRGFTDWGEGIPEDGRPYVAVYFGGQNPSHEPGYYQAFLSPNGTPEAEIDPLGDINNDGYDDFSYTYLAYGADIGMSRSVFIMGGSMTEIVWRQFNNASYVSFSPAGDVNNDGFDDYLCFFLAYIKTNTLYYGSANVLPADSLVLYSGQDIITWRAKGLGDLNADGFADFTGLMRYPNTYVWYGNNNVSASYDFIITPNWDGTNDIDRGLVHGDLNNDGYDDVIGSAPWSHGDTGAFRVWLGGANMNGTSDLEIVGHLTGMLFGTGMATGDFNGDGYCDVAASEPHSEIFDSTPGRVYVYRGNAQLADTTPVEDETLAPQINAWNFTVIPNPLTGKQSWKLKLTGKGYEKYRDITVKIHNLKGQHIRTFSLKHSQVKSGEINLDNLKLPAGIYEISLYNKGTLLKTQKATIK